MPYVTEEVWAELGGSGAGPLLTANWPELPLDLHDPASASEMEWVVATISAIRAIRNEINVPAGARVPLLVKDADALVTARLDRHREHLLRLARVETIALADTAPAGSVSVVVEGTTLILPLGEVVDLGQEKTRLGKEIGRLDADLAKFAAKLGNPGFLAKAKPEVIEEQREREADTRRDRDRLKAAYERLETV
jgi:valyl-tRNA synthetase